MLLQHAGSCDRHHWRRDALAVARQFAFSYSTCTLAGMDMVHQTSALAQRPHFVVATPGRLADILADPLNNVMKRIKFLVLDEADRLLDPSFEPALAVIFSCIPPSRSTFLFSATITDAITQLRALSNVCQFIFRASVLAATSGHDVMSPLTLLLACGSF